VSSSRLTIGSPVSFARPCGRSEPIDAMTALMIACERVEARAQPALREVGASPLHSARQAPISDACRPTCGSPADRAPRPLRRQRNSSAARAPARAARVVSQRIARHDPIRECEAAKRPLILEPTNPRATDAWLMCDSRHDGRSLGRSWDDGCSRLECLQRSRSCSWAVGAAARQAAPRAVLPLV
jgi:hypothetical protein